MKRHANLWEGLTSFENLLLAARKAHRGKRPGCRQGCCRGEPI